jgi:hypothetical protein
MLCTTGVEAMLTSPTITSPVKEPNMPKSPRISVLCAVLLAGFVLTAGAKDTRVIVTNGPDEPVPVRNADESRRVLYQTMVRGRTPVLPGVPAGKRLVIQNVSARAFVVGKAVGMLKLQVGGTAEFVFPMTFAGTEDPLPGDVWVGHFPTTIYVDPGQVAQFILEAPFLNPSVQATVSGFLVDCPPCSPIAP